MRSRRIVSAIWPLLAALGLVFASFADDTEALIDTSVVRDLKSTAEEAGVADVREYRRTLDTTAAKKTANVRSLRKAIHQFLTSTQTAEPPAPRAGYRAASSPTSAEFREPYRHPLLAQLTAELMGFYLEEWKRGRLSEGRLCDLMKRGYLFVAVGASPRMEPLAFENGAVKMFFYALWESVTSGEIHPCREMTYYTLHADRFALPNGASSGAIIEFGPHRLVRSRDESGPNYHWAKGYAPLSFLSSGQALAETVPDLQSILSLWAYRTRRAGLAL